jgi:murein DD-endopeptidase MepM/ murein hydrolase activator NlpD
MEKIQRLLSYVIPVFAFLVIAGLYYFLSEVVNDIRLSRDTLKQECLNYGEQKGWDNCVELLNTYLGNVRNGIMTEARIKARFRFDEDTLKYYKVSILSSHERNNSKLKDITNEGAYIQDVGSFDPNYIRQLSKHLAFIYPLNENKPELTSTYGYRILSKNTGPSSQRKHAGLDMGVPDSREVKSSLSGLVIQRGRYGDYGNKLKIRTVFTNLNNDQKEHVIDIVYGHLAKFKINKNNTVGKGQLIAIAGNTGKSEGVHLHFEVYLDGNVINPYYLFENLYVPRR